MEHDCAAAGGVDTTQRRRVIADALGVGLATAVVGLAFGGIAVTTGFSAAQAMVLSTAMFTGGSQFALVSGLAGGGSIGAALAVAWLLGARNGLYALRLRTVLPAHGLRKWIATHLVIDESMAMAVTRPTPELARLGFWATGLSVFVGWNLATAIGALVGSLVDDPARYGLDVMFPAAFLALIWPQLRGAPALVTAALAAIIAIGLIPLAPRGVPVIAAALATLAGTLAERRKHP